MIRTDIPILSKLFKARDKPQNLLPGSSYSFFFGPTTSGKQVNEYTAMQTTAVYACVRILSEALASLPLHLYRYTEKGKERVYDHPLARLLHDEPNPEMTSFVFRETLMSHLLIWGNAYAQIIRDWGSIRSCQTRWRSTEISGANWSMPTPTHSAKTRTRRNGP